jgi:hypothetical protein
MQRRDSAILPGVAAAAVAGIVAGIFAWLGVVNGDEGWYVLGARLVGQGRLPYRDFAFTQGPAYLYVLAPFVRLVPGLYSARAVSVICTAVAVGLLVTVARRVGGKWAAIASGAALLAAIPSLPYWLSITKTYALSCLLLAAILFTLTSPARPAIRLPLAAALAVGFAETRITGLALAVLLIAAIVARSPDTKTRVRIALASAATALPFVFLVLGEWTRARWGLVDYHQLGATGSGIGQYFSRTFAAARAWPGPFLLGAAATAVTLVNVEMRARLKRRLDLTAVAVGIVLFVVLSEAGGSFFAEEYLAPVVAPLVVVSIVILVRALANTDARTRSRRYSLAVRSVLIAGIAVTALTGGHSDYLGLPGWKGDPAAMSAITRCVQRYSRPGDAVFALSLEEVVVEANRQPAPNVSLGMFSYQDVSTKRAQALKILNSETLGTLFMRRPPKVAVLTAADIFETQRAGWFSHHFTTNIAFYLAFRAYHPVCRETVERHVFSNVPVAVTVYARTGARP